MADKQANTRTVSLMYNRLWYEWAYSFGMCIAIVVLSCYCSIFALPAIVLLAAWLLNLLSETDRAKHGSHCLLIVRQTSSTLTISVAIFAAYILIESITGHTGRTKNLPQIAALIIFSTWSLMLAILMTTHGFSRHCGNCKVRHGLSPHDAFVGNMLHNESKYQLRLAIVLSTLLVILNLIYLTAYTHNLKPLLYIQVAVYILSLMYLGAVYTYTVHIMRTANIKLYNTNITTLRYLVLRGDKLLVATVPNKLTPQVFTIDTPSSVNIAFSQEVADATAIERFQAISGIDKFTLRKLYNNCSFADSANVFHYAILIDDAEPLPNTWELGNDWMTLDQINRAWRYGDLSPALAAEIHRIFTITMTWKTYDRQGHRLYPIKNYHPTFRLRDFKNWDVDYNDMQWIRISEDNQDKPMFKARKFITKIATLHVR